MNATKIAKGRAATSTTRRLAGSAQELQQRALAAAGTDIHDVMQKCAADILGIKRQSAIEAIKGNAERWAERVKRATAALHGVKVTDYNWGAEFNGSKAALIKAGLLSAQLVPAKGRSKEYQLPLNWSDGYHAACYGTPRLGRIPPCWDAKSFRSDFAGDGPFSVAVMFNPVNDLNVRERTERAFKEMDRPDVNMALLRRLVAEIPPLPLSVQIPESLKAAKSFPSFPKGRK